MKRRNSISSFKKDRFLLGRPRSNSLPKEPVGIMSSISKIRENLLNSPEFKQLSNKSLLKEKNTTSKLTTKGNNQSSVDINKKELVRIFSLIFPRKSNLIYI